jgi:hypothetical protein
MASVTYIAIPEIETTLDGEVKFQGFPLVSAESIYHDAANFEVIAESGSRYIVQFNGLTMPDDEQYLPMLNEYAENLVRGYEASPVNFTRVGPDIEPETYEE